MSSQHRCPKCWLLWSYMWALLVSSDRLSSVCVLSLWLALWGRTQMLLQSAESQEGPPAMTLSQKHSLHQRFAESGKSTGSTTIKGHFCVSPQPLWAPPCTCTAQMTLCPRKPCYKPSKELSKERGKCLLVFIMKKSASRDGTETWQDPHVTVSSLNTIKPIALYNVHSTSQDSLMCCPRERQRYFYTKQQEVQRS